MADFDKRYKKGSILCTKSELRKYLDEERLERKQELDILSRWKVDQFHYPVLSRLACDVLTILVSIVTSESVFSIGARVIHQYRSCLLPETIQALLCTRDWFFDKRALRKESADLEEHTINPSIAYTLCECSPQNQSMEHGMFNPS
ncbi:hypothetical protein DVH24_038242 [Malus domestica]|uniref:HAT C-terminal dimerisation domain-containing protein n=1 Tax=Malus domestica TaxID=3750 RepID=A0A498K962_MALDO|nr:hypothetical protein DVH24_038242 [Malus domestica]